jgi:murein DD-endopeptidase MepM/ murein hydrolase activator NlpD
MTISFDAALNQLQSPERRAAAREDEVRRAASEFEAMLLSHLTASLNPEKDGEEDDLFGGGSSDFYRQMFSEQMARVMAGAGGVGLAGALLQQLGLEAGDKLPRRANRLAELANLVRGAESAPALDASPAERPVGRAANRGAKPDFILNAAGPPGAAADAGSAEVDLQIPVEGRISSHFGERRDPVHGRSRHHAGIDIAVERGTPIAAAGPGTVVFAGRRGGYGNLVEIKHQDGRLTRYAHAERILVSPGDVVRAGQTIATVGSTGRSTGPHLHFEVSDGGAAVDPLESLAKDSALARR